MDSGGQNPYAGRWVARLGGNIVGQGGTPDQARQAALSRFKEKPEIVFMPPIDPFVFPPILEKIFHACPTDQELFLVGGAVRDMLLGRELHDFDITLPHDGIRVARKVADALSADFYPLDPERDTGRVLLPVANALPILVDFTSFRGANLDADLSGRDFTINAIALELRTRQVYDPLGGAQDLKEKCLRTCSPFSFSEDPVRILRAIRLAGDYDLHIVPQTRQAMKDAAPELIGASPERIRDELFRVLEGQKPSTCMRGLDIIGALEVILPDTIVMKGFAQPSPHVYDVWEHTLAMLRWLEDILRTLSPDAEPENRDDLFSSLLLLHIGRYKKQIHSHLTTPLADRRTMRGLLFMACIYHDSAKPHAKQEDERGDVHFWEHDQMGAEIVEKRGRLLAFSNEEIGNLSIIVRNHMRISFHANRSLNDGKHPSRRAIYRFFRDAGELGVDLCLLALADVRATFGNTLSQDVWEATLGIVHLFMENWFDKPTESISPLPFLNGDDLMARFDLKPSPKIGELLLSIREAQATGKVCTREQAFSHAAALLAGYQGNGG